MDLIAFLLLALEAAFGFLLLYREGLLNTRRRALLAAVLLAAAFLLRGVCFPYETLDYQNFLSKWVDFYRRNLGFRSLAYPLGNYNIPYLYFLCLFSYLPIRDLYLIKLLSCLFDVLLAFGAMRLAGDCGAGGKARIGCFFTVLFLPTVVLNGALWGQCDSIYVALALLGLSLALEGSPVLSMLCFTLSFGFKLQAVFIMPVMGVLWFRGDYRLRHFALFPLFYVLLVLPAVLLGKPFLETLSLYASQTGSIGDALNYNSPSVYAFFWRLGKSPEAARLGIVCAFVFMFLLLLYAFCFRRRLTNRAVLALALLFAIGIPFLLPHMHDRYFFGADVLSAAFAFVFWPAAPAALLVQFASLLGYHAYLKMRYLLYMDHGARALIAALVIVGGSLLYLMHGKGGPGALDSGAAANYNNINSNKT